jgi:hypothetical protein
MPDDRRRGRVEAYDPHRGWGTVVGDDGSRAVPVGAVVTYVRIPAHLGRYEAGAITRG